MSVVIPAYNAAATIVETLASVLAQTLGDFEAIVVDDGSTDATAQVAAEFVGGGEARVRIVSVENGGVSHARNRGTALAAGELVAFLDADDIWLPTKLERQVEMLSVNPGADMCVTAATRIDGAGNELGPMPLRRVGDNCAALLLGSMVLGCTSSGMFRRSALDRLGGFNPRFSQCADWDLWLRFSASGEIACVDESLVLYRTAAGNMSSNIELLERDTFAVLDDFFAGPHGAAFTPLRRRTYANHWMICAGSYLSVGHRAAALRCLRQALRTDPRTIGRPLGLPARRLRRRRQRQARPQPR